MVNETEWINLPIGYNLAEQMNTDAIVTHPDVVFYDFYAAWTDPITADKDAYLGNRTGILTQAAPNIGPMMWDLITVADGTTRQLQWTSRVEGDSSITNSTHAMTMSQYLGRGQVSRGRATISSTLSMSVSTQPFFHNDGDKEAVIQGIKNIQAALSGVEGLEWIRPLGNQTAEDYVDSLLVTANGRRANHWMGKFLPSFYTLSSFRMTLLTGHVSQAPPKWAPTTGAATTARPWSTPTRRSTGRTTSSWWTRPSSLAS